MLQELRELNSELARDPELKQHFSSKTMGQLIERTLGFDKHKLYQPYIRIAEQIEAQNLTQAAQAQMAEDAAGSQALTDPNL